MKLITFLSSTKEYIAGQYTPTFSRQLLFLVNWQRKTYCLTQNNFQVGFKCCQKIHKAYRQVCCKEPLSFALKITSLVSFGFAPFNLHCYGKPLDLDRAQNHWGHHNGVWQLLFSHLFGSKIKIPGKVNLGSIEISHTTLETAVNSEYLLRCVIHIDVICSCVDFMSLCMQIHVKCEFRSLKHQAFRKFRKHIINAISIFSFNL